MNILLPVITFFALILPTLNLNAAVTIDCNVPLNVVCEVSDLINEIAHIKVQMETAQGTVNAVDKAFDPCTTAATISWDPIVPNAKFSVTPCDGNLSVESASFDGLKVFPAVELPKLGCCSYKVNSSNLCANPTTFSDCKGAAKKASSRKFRWGKGICRSGVCEGTKVQEHLKVTLAEFTAKNLGKSVLLEWTTINEVNSIAFHIWRGIPKGKTCTQNPANYIDIKQLKDSANPDKPLTIWTLGNPELSAYYFHIDNDVELDVTYCYILEDVDSAYNSIHYLDFITPVTIKNMKGNL